MACIVYIRIHIPWFSCFFLFQDGALWGGSRIHPRSLSLEAGNTQSGVSATLPICFHFLKVYLLLTVTPDSDRCSFTSTNKSAHVTYQPASCFTAHLQLFCTKHGSCCNFVCRYLFFKLMKKARAVCVCYGLTYWEAILGLIKPSNLLKWFLQLECALNLCVHSYPDIILI